MNRTEKSLLRKIESRRAHISVIGLGYVGLPLALAFVKKGFRVTGIDLDQDRVERIRRGRSYVEDISSREIARSVRGGRFEASEGYDRLTETDVIIICVPTPLNRAKDPDLSYIVRAAEAIGNHLRAGKLVILESTTYPGTTEEIILPIFERSGLKVGRDIFLCFSPERIDPGNKSFSLARIPKVVGGVTPECSRLGQTLYKKIIDKVISVSSTRTAEMTKLLENTFRIVNIGLVNELARVAQRLGVNVWEAIEAASTKPFGYMAFYPGPGIGGHCIGIDPVYLSWKARLQGVDIHFIELARRINAEMPRFVVERAVYTLNDRAGKAVKGSKILLLGVSYKADVGDTRESPALDILHGLRDLGAVVSYHDPFVPQLKTDDLDLRSEPLSAGNLRRKDLVIVVTNHSRTNYALIAKHARLIFDTRNVKSPVFKTNKVVHL
jgi:UDP-N-acetyl-D-glucosamine dehydrogenase